MAEQITRDFTPFKEGQQVWLDSKNLRFFQNHKKLQLKRQGPFEITEVLGPLVKTVPRGVRGSGVPVRSSADTGEGFGEVI